MQQPQSTKIERVLSVFSVGTDELIAEHPLPAFDLPEFRRHFGVTNAGEVGEMVCEYEVGPQDVVFLSPYLTERVEFDFGRYAYFLSCHETR